MTKSNRLLLLPLLALCSACTMHARVGDRAAVVAEKDLVLRVDTRIRLRLLRPSDAPTLFALAHRNRQTLDRHHPGLLSDWYPTQAAAAALIERRRANWRAFHDDVVRHNPCKMQATGIVT